MDRDRPPVVDAEFEVVNEPYPKPKWWQGWYFDWRIFAVIAATSFAGFIARLTEQ